MTPRPALADLPPQVDLVVVGGGITGAGVLREAVRTGVRTLLLEQGDYAAGTSSGSSKLVHGGLRYLKTGQWRLTLESVGERQRLLREAAGLVETQPFLMPVYRGMSPGRAALRAGLWLYDRMAGTQTSRWVDAAATRALEPHLRHAGLLGAMLYEDARTDDARLVLRILGEALAEGAVARNYTAVSSLRRRDGCVVGVIAQDVATGATREIGAAVVVNATGAWATALDGAGSGAPKLRPLRGSHFVFDRSALPVAHAVSWLHPRDRRPVFAYPWEGATLYGTTDLDHDVAPGPARMSAVEAEYLLEGLSYQFPSLNVGVGSAVSSYGAVRPIVAGGKASPSAESRESALWTAPGLVGITGGKLTTFRVTARQVLRTAARQDARLAPGPAAPVFAAAPSDRWRGRLGRAHDDFMATSSALERRPFGGTPYSLAELRFAARTEQVVHLDDLLLRRTRLGLVAPAGGRALLPDIRRACQAELGWDDDRWIAEERRYLELWRRDHEPAAA